MPHSGSAAMHGSIPAEHERAHDADSPGPQQHDITPEVFRRFMSYERAQLAKGLSPAATFADLDIPTSMMQSRNSYSSSRGGEPNHGQASIPRMIRGIPRRSFDATSPSTASKAASAPASRSQPAPSQAFANDDAVGSRSPAGQSRRPASNAALSGLAAVTPQSLSQDFQHLSVSPQRDSHVSDPSNVQSDAHFQFPSLPPKLTDDGFHYRQRAAQFILLCSQEATPDRLTKLNRLSLPLVPRSRAGGHSRRGAGASKLDDMDRSTMHDDDESVHSHHDPHNASDDDSEYLDFDACRSAHLGNKKKRKSSRFSSPGLTTTSSSTTFDQNLQHDAVASHSQPANKGSDRALVDRTNLASQAYPLSIADHEAQRNGDLLAYAKLELASFRFPESARLPPRQSRGEYLMQRLRNRVRTRVASVLLQRRYAQMEAERQARREDQARREAQLAQSKVDADAQQAASPERKAPPKRANKAGKRAQAIRGGNSASKPLTIAEIRARAAAAASGGAPNGTTAAKTQTSPSPTQKGSSPTRKGSDTSDAMKQETRDDKVETKQTETRRDSTPRAGTPPAPISKPRQQSPPPNGVATQAKRDVMTPPPHPKVTLPTSTFDFRMSSAVTLRLRELRSQLDAATRNLSDTAKAGDTHAVAQALSETVAAPPSAPVRPVDPPMVPADIPPIPPRGPNWDVPDDAPPWVRHALDYQYHLEQQQAKARLGRQSAKNSSAPAVAPSSHPPPPAAASQSRSESSTPGRSPHVGSPAPPSSAKAPAAVRTKAKPTNGRRTTTRKSTTASDSHKHSSACKHGHPHSHSHSSGLGSALFTPDDWICLFCEYELYYGEPPLMLRACRNRKKLVEKKSKAKNKAQAALSKKSVSKTNGASSAAGGGGCGHHHHDDGHHHDYSDHGCEHGCCHDHGSVTSEDHHHQQQHGHGHGGGAEGEGDRERCDCGNSIHSSDFDEEHH